MGTYGTLRGVRVEERTWKDRSFLPSYSLSKCAAVEEVAHMQLPPEKGSS